MASDKNWLQIRILHRKIHRIKEKKNILFYMTLNDNNTKQIYVLVFILYYLIYSCSYFIIFFYFTILYCMSRILVSFVSINFIIIINLLVAFFFFSASLKLLHDTVSTGGCNAGNKFGELVLKCNWKIIQMLSKRSNDLELSVILKDVHHFLVVSWTFSNIFQIRIWIFFFFFSLF